MSWRDLTLGCGEDDKGEGEGKEYGKIIFDLKIQLELVGFSICLWVSLEQLLLDQLAFRVVMVRVRAL